MNTEIEPGPKSELKTQPELPEGWKWVKLDLMADKLSLNKLKIKQRDYLEQGKYPVVDQGQELIGGYFDDYKLLVPGNPPFIVFGDHTKIKKFLRFRFVPGADGLKVLKAKQNVDPLYFYYCLHTIKIDDKGYARHFQFVEKALFPLPPFPIQQAIVAKIEELFSELDQSIASLKTAQQQLKIYRQAVLKWAFEGKLHRTVGAIHESPLPESPLPESPLREGPLPIAAESPEPYGNQEMALQEKGNPDLPEGWKWVKLGELLEDISSGKSYKCDERPPIKDEAGIVKVSSVTWGVFDETESKTCYSNDLFRSQYAIAKGDFLFSRANTIDLVGACVIVERITKRLMLSDKILRFSFHTKVKKEYVLHYLRSRKGRKEIEMLSTGNQDSMRNIGQERIRQIQIPFSSLIDQEAVVTAIESRLSVADNLEESIRQSLDKAEALRQSILKKAFEGKLI